MEASIVPPESTTTTTRWWSHEAIQWWLLITVVLAVCIHRTILTPLARQKKDASPHPESRLLRKQFGVLEEDVLLQEKEFQDPSSSSSLNGLQNHTKLDDAAASPTSPPTQHSHRPVDPIDDDSESVTKDERRSSHEKKKSTQLERLQQYRRQRLAAAADRRHHAQRPPAFRRDDDQHPGLAAFGKWWEVETSLFRIFTITRKDGRQDETTIAPYNPSSRRGLVPVLLHVTNDMNVPITVYWIDFHGTYVNKGSILSDGGVWRQTTWIDHPWVFCAKLEGREVTLLHYIPYRVIPTTSEAPTIDSADSPVLVAVHRFHILPAPSDSVYSCQVEDPILPHPTALSSSRKAAELALLHCHRMNYSGWATLSKYIRQILDHPDQAQYRQIRLANPTFSEWVWNTPARGVLFAFGFIEHGGYAEFGSETPLSPDTVSEVALWLHMIELWQKRADGNSRLSQPEGADGYGRAGFGR